MSTFLNLNKHDFTKGLITAVFASVFTVFYSVTQAPDFDLFSIDWSQVIANVVNVAVITFMSYMGKNLLTNSDGQFMEKEI